jgi:hypothetical protein
MSEQMNVFQDDGSGLALINTRFLARIMKTSKDQLYTHTHTHTHTWNDAASEVGIKYILIDDFKKMKSGDDNFGWVGGKPCHRI